MAALAIFLELVVQGLETYPQDFGGAGLHDQHSFRFVDGVADAHRDHAAVVGEGSSVLLPAESRGKMPGIEGRAVRAQDYGALDSVAQLARIARPVVCNHAV